MVPTRERHPPAEPIIDRAICRAQLGHLGLQLQACRSRQRAHWAAAKPPVSYGRVEKGDEPLQHDIVRL